MPTVPPPSFFSRIREQQSPHLVRLALLATVILVGCSSGSAPVQSGPAPLPPVLAARGGVPQPIVTPTPDAVLQSLDTDIATPDLPPEIRESVEQARRQSRNGDLSDALRGYRQIVAGGQAPAQVQIELAQVELANDETEAARDTLNRLIEPPSVEAIRRRAQLLLGTTELSLGNWEAAVRHLDVEAAPDGLVDLVILRRAEALLRSGDRDGAKHELERVELRDSTNRLFLEQAGQLANEVDRPDLSAQFYARATQYPGSADVVSHLIESAAVAFDRDGKVDSAIEQYRMLIEDYGWTSAAARAGGRLYELDRLTGFYAGLLALQQGQYETAWEGFAEAAQGGSNAEAAQEWLRWLEERSAWADAVDEGTVEAFQSFRNRYPNGTNATDAQFREGLLLYEDGQLEAALHVWSEIPPQLSGNDRARLHFWAAKALGQLGRDAESRAQLQVATEQGLSNYYALRARDLLAGIQGWPTSSTGSNPSPDAERAAVERWLAELPGAVSPANAEEARVRRGLGLLALGLIPEATVELNGLISESTDGHRLFRLAELLAQQELWSSASLAADKLVKVSPSKTIDQAPLAVQRLAYPTAYWDLVRAEAQQLGVDPLLLLSLICQESDYDRFALSSAGARGLTQVMPATGEGIAAAIGRSGFTADDLYRPSIAIEFGALYLSGQLERFDGDPFRALAAYNAGAGPVSEWAADDPDLFVERIDYAETRRFVQSLYRHYAVYRVAVADRPSPPPP